ncbi:OB-fold protein [Flavobacterium chungangense]|uniref:tRNA_anti-like n=1 Tax=Flavobacterium chungangense TaxID=554283 RepID=A0A6V6ZEA4_9FLAO|nr:hypothetical protein [Flavobacterium chungangense]CAD0009222.1 hypothetical protein FLACHUCJ7_04166 [Flavobacterium chungangense]
MKKKLILTILAIVAFGIFGYCYVWYGGARNVSAEDAVFNVTSKSIIAEFDADIDKSNTKYLEKAIAIKGIVSKADQKQVILDNTIVCDLKELDPAIKEDQEITLKGRVVGYDDLMGEIKLDECTVINND